MQHLANTLYLQTQGAYLNLDHDTLRISIDGQNKKSIPLHHVSQLCLFGNIGISPFLIHRCANDGKSIAWFTETGRFQARTEGKVSGNVLLRQAQHLIHGNEEKTLDLAMQFVYGKIYNSRMVLLRYKRDYPDLSLELICQALQNSLKEVYKAKNLEHLRGIEGNASADYFSSFPLIIRNPLFEFVDRNRRPPRDMTNALLSFVYALCTTECASALQGVGLDPQVGFLHTLRSGRASLALDLIEEFRSWFADRFVIGLINRKQINPKHFEERPGGAVLLSEEGRKVVLIAYQERKKDTLLHPMFKTPVPIGLVPHIQVRLLARYLRGDLENYPPYKWK